MTTSAKHIWTRTANRREPAKAIFFFNQIVFLIMFLFLPKLLIRHLEDFLLRGKCNKLVRFPRLPPVRGGGRRPCLRRGVPGPAAGVPASRVAGAASPLGAERRNAMPVARARAAGSAPRRGPPHRAQPAATVPRHPPGWDPPPPRPSLPAPPEPLRPSPGRICAANEFGDPVFTAYVSPNYFPPAHRERNYN